MHYLSRTSRIRRATSWRSVDTATIPATTPKSYRWALNLPDGAVTVRAVGERKLRPAGRLVLVAEQLTPWLVDPVPGSAMHTMAAPYVSVPGETRRGMAAHGFAKGAGGYSRGRVAAA